MWALYLLYSTARFEAIISSSTWSDTGTRLYLMAVPTALRSLKLALMSDMLANTTPSLSLLNEYFNHFTDRNLLPRVALMPGFECCTRLVVCANSPSLCPIMFAVMRTFWKTLPS